MHLLAVRSVSLPFQYFPGTAKGGHHTACPRTRHVQHFTQALLHIKEMQEMFESRCHLPANAPQWMSHCQLLSHCSSDHNANWAHLLLALPLEIATAGGRTNALYIKRRKRSRWWSREEFPRVGLSSLGECTSRSGRSKDCPQNTILVQRRQDLFMECRGMGLKEGTVSIGEVHYVKYSRSRKL